MFKLERLEDRTLLSTLLPDNSGALELNQTGANGSPQPGGLNRLVPQLDSGPEVTSSSPAAGQVVTPTAPTTFSLTFSEPIVPSSVDPGDFTVNGIPAASDSLSPDDTTIYYSYHSSPVTQQGTESMNLPANSVIGANDGLSNPVAFSANFYDVVTQLQVSATSPAEGTVLTVPVTDLVVDFNTAYNPNTLSPSGFQLSQGTVEEVVPLTPQSVQLSLSGVTHDGSLTLTVPAGAIQDGFGVPNAAFTGTYVTDIVSQPYPALLQGVNPAGSEIYDATVTGSIGFVGDTDSYTLSLAAGQTLSLVLSTDPALIGMVTLLGPGGSTIASAPAAGAGDAAVLETAPIATAGTYSLVVTGSGGTTGNYALQAILNAAFKPGAATNSSIASAEDLSQAFSSLGTTPAADRAGVLGMIDSAGDADFYKFYLSAGQSTSLAADGLNGDVSLGLWNQSGNLLATITPPQASINNFVAPISGWYYAAVSGAPETNYCLVVTRNADFTLHGSSFSTAQPLAGTDVVLGAIVPGLPTAGNTGDWYQFNVNAGDNLVITTTTPGNRSGNGDQFVNALDPTINLYDPDGNLVATATGNASDGLSDVINSTALTSGGYRVQIIGASPTNLGEYTISIQGATGGESPLAVSSTSPAAGADSGSQVSTMTVSFTSGVLLSSVSTSDFTIDGNDATSVTVLSSNMLSFSFPTTANGIHNVSISGLESLQGVTMAAETLTFQTDDVAPVAVSSSIADGSVLSPGPLTEVITFSKPIQPSTVSAADISLYGEIRGTGYTPSSFSLDPTDTILTINYANLPADAYKFTLAAGPDNFTSIAGVPLQNAFIVNFTMRAGTSIITGLQPVLPLGSRVYQTTIDNVLLTSNDVDTYSLAIDPQQTLAVVATPVTPAMTVTVVLISPTGHEIGSATSASPGAPVVLPGVQSSTGGTYQIEVSGDPGEYTFTPTLNALIDPAAYGGPSHSTIATALAIDPYANTIVGNDTEGAVLGDIGNDASPTYSFELNQGVSATIVVSSLNGMNVSFSVYDDEGDLLASSSAGAANFTAGLNNFVSRANGTYYIQVSGDVGDQFNLVLTEGADFTTQPNNSVANAQDITATEGSGDNKLGGVVGYLGAGVADYYTVNTNAGDNLSFSTGTPAGGPNEFVNNLDPELLLFDPNGDLVAIAAGNAADGRNSVIDFTVPGGYAGQWIIEITASPSTSQPTQGEYGLLVTGATGSLSPYAVTSTTPPPGALVQPPSTITVTFNDPVFVSSLTAGELKVNGVAADAVTAVNGNTVTWTIDPNSYAKGIDLPNVVTIGADANGDQIKSVSGQTLIPFSYTFFTTDVAPTVVSSSIDGQVFSPAPANATEVITFSQPMNTSLTTASSFELHGNYRNVSYAAASWSWDPTGTILTINFSDLPDDTYTLTLLASGFQNTVGIGLASDYTANFAVALGSAAFGGTFTPVAPAGSLIYTGTDTHVLATSSDIDYLSISLNAGETLTVIATPTTSSLQLVLGVFDPSFTLVGITTASAQGENAVLETVTAATTGSYLIGVTDVIGNLGLYSIQAYLNSYVKQGTSNDTIATARDISGSSFILGTSGADRLGVVGSLPSNQANPPVPDTQDYYSFSLSQGQSATIVAKSLNGDNVGIALVDGNGNVLATGAGGATNVDASIENFVATESGTYYVEITGDPGLQYSLVVTRGATFSVQPHNAISSAENVTGTNGVLGDLGPPIAPQNTVVDDWYSVNVQAGQSLVLQSSTPSDQGGQFPNTASVEIELFDTFGNLVAVGTKLADGRNESLFFNAPISGAYYIEVSEDPGGAGEYYLSVNTASYSSGGASGEVYNDSSGRGSLVPGDSSLSGWEVDLYDANNNLVASQVTDANGDFHFQGLDPGTYTVTEKLQAGWTQTAPSSLSFTISVAAGSTVTGLDFGDFQNITISGLVYNDLNRNGTDDPGEPGLQGWTIDLFDAFGNLVATTTTDVDGDYRFANLGPGTYTVHEELQPGWIATQPASSGTYTVVATSGQSAPGLAFGNFETTTISGVVYNDMNGSGVPSPFDPNLANWTIDLEDASGNVLATVVSSSTGRFSFSNVPAGTYLVAEVVPSNWVQTQPFYPTVYTINIQSGMNVSGLVFGDHASPALNPSVVIDNGQPGYAETGSWSTAPGGYAGTSRTAATTSGGVATATASWTFGGLASGTYAVYVTYVGNSSYSPAAPFTVADGGTALGTVDVNESIAVTQSQGGLTQGSYGGVGWLKLGTFTINSGTLVVLLSNKASGQFVDADGILIVPQSAPPIVSPSSTIATSDVSTDLGTIPPFDTNPPQMTSTTVNGTSPTLAIGGVSEPVAVHVVYNQGNSTSNSTTSSSLIDEALNQFDTAGKKKSLRRPEAHRRGDRRHAVIRSSSSHPTRRAPR